MANTFELIASSTVGSGGAASIDFTSIPSTFTDLVLKVSARDTSSDSSPSIRMTFNGSTSGYSNRRLVGFSGTSIGSGQDTSIAYGSAGFSNTSIHTASTFSNSEVYIPNYTSSNNKSFSMDTVIENNSSTINALALYAQIWANTSVISSISLVPESGTFVQHSTAYLYGVKNA